MSADAYLLQYIRFHRERACSVDFEIKLRGCGSVGGKVEKGEARTKGRQSLNGTEVNRERERERERNSALLISKVYRGRRKSVRTPGVLLCLIDRALIIDLPSPRSVPSILTPPPPLRVLEESITIIQRELLPFE